MAHVPADIRGDQDPDLPIIRTDPRADVRTMADSMAREAATAALAADSLRRIRTTTIFTTITETSRRDLPSRSRSSRRRQQRRRQTSQLVMHTRRTERIRRRIPRRITRRRPSTMTAVPVISVPTSSPVTLPISSPMMRLWIRCTWAARARRR